MRRGPAREAANPVVGGGAGLGAIDIQRQSGVRGQFHGLKQQVELSDDRVLEVLDPAKVLAHVVRRPPGPKLVTAGRQFTDQVRQFAVVWVATSTGVQDRNGFVGRLIPVEIKEAGPLVEEPRRRCLRALSYDLVGAVVGGFP